MTADTIPTVRVRDREDEFHRAIGRAPAQRCQTCGRHFIARILGTVDCKLCQRHFDPRGGMFEVLDAGRWRPNPYTRRYLASEGHEIARCGACGYMRYKPIGWFCGSPEDHAQKEMWEGGSGYTKDDDGSETTKEISTGTDVQSP